MRNIADLQRRCFARAGCRDADVPADAEVPPEAEEEEQRKTGGKRGIVSSKRRAR